MHENDLVNLLFVKDNACLAKQQNNSVDLKTLVCGIVHILFCQLRTTHKSKQFKKIIKC